MSSSVALNHSKPLKVLFDKEASQKRKREILLEWQQRRRDEILDKIRQLESYDSSASDNESDPPLSFLEVMKSRKRTHDKIEVVEEISDEEEKEEQVNGNDDVNDVLTDIVDSTAVCADTMENEMLQEVPGTSEQSKKKRKRKKKKPVADVPVPNNTQKQKLSHKRISPTELMLSEWLTEKPDDFSESWAGVFCPVGKRTLLFSTRKETRAFGRRGEYLGQFQSALPSGNADCYKGNRTRGVTLLDCIYSETSQVFYVLDLICWNSHSCVNCDLEYRQFFLTSKFAENPELQTVTRNNQVPLILLPYFNAQDFSQTSVCSLYPSFPEKVDGILFCHKDGFYIPETNPLCLWILLSQVEDKLGVTLDPEILAKQQPCKKRNIPARMRKSSKSDMET